MWTTWFWASMFIHQYDSVTIGIEILGRNKQNRIQQIHKFFSKMCISSKMKRIFCCLFFPIIIWTLSKCSFLSMYSHWSLREMFPDIGTVSLCQYSLSQDAGTWFEML